MPLVLYESAKKTAASRKKWVYRGCGLRPHPIYTHHRASEAVDRPEAHPAIPAYPHEVHVFP